MSAVLTITKLGDKAIRFTFESKRRRPFAGPTQEVWDVEVHPNALLKFCRDMNDAANTANAKPWDSALAVDPFVRAGQGLFCEVLPKGESRVRELLTKLRRLKSPLLISTDEPNLFWELLYDVEQKSFLGLKHRVGRRLMTRDVPAGALRNRQQWSCLMIADPTGDLPQTAREAAQLRDWLKARNFQRVDYLAGADANFDSVLAAVSRQPYDIIHYAGHTELDSKSDEYALRLHKQMLFRAGLISRHLKGNPFVFLNGCWSGLAKGLDNNPGSVVGLTEAFLAGGAQVVVGSQFEVPDSGARAFAEKFYQALLDGECVGEAMRQARLGVKQAPDCAAAWACFVLYGDPAVQLNLQEDQLGDLLASVQLKREDFDEQGLGIVQQALDYSDNSKLVSTAELFAALVDSSSGIVRARLKEQGIAVTELASAFKSALQDVNEKLAGSAKGKTVHFSPNTATIVVEAGVCAKEADRQSIAEQDLLRAFVRKKGGNTRSVLNEVGVNIQQLCPEPPARPRADKLRRATTGHSEKSGFSLDRSDFTEAAWASVSEAGRLAAHSRDSLLGTPQFFAGLLHNPDGPLACALRRLNLSKRFETQSPRLNGESRMATAASPVVGTWVISFNTREILERARKLAGARDQTQIAEADLLDAFVFTGGGSVGAYLREKIKLLPAALASRLFLIPSNQFDLRCFSGELHPLLKWAGARGGALLGRRHFLLFMLADEDALLSRLAVKQGLDVAVRQKLSKQVSADTAAAESIVLSVDLANVLAEAEVEMRKRRMPRMAEPVLLWSLLRHSQDMAAQFAETLEMDLAGMMEDVQKKLEAGAE